MRVSAFIRCAEAVAEPGGMPYRQCTMRVLLTLVVMVLLCACSAPGTTEETSASRVQTDVLAGDPVGLTCARQQRAQLYSGRAFPTVKEAARWDVPASGEVGQVLQRNRYTRTFAILDGSGEVVAEVGVERLNGGWARASRATCA